MKEKDYDEFLKSGKLQKPLRAFLLDVKGTTSEGTGVIIIDDCLDELYRVCDCDTIDIVKRKIGGVWCDIVCDDDGLFKTPQRIGAIDSDGNIALMGNLLICSHNDEGDLVDITEEQEKAVKKSLAVLCLE